jgi:hypothetical protein
VGSGGQSISAVQGTSDLGNVFFAAQEDVPGTGDTDGLTDVHRSDGRTIEVLTGVRPQASGGQPVTGFHATGTASSVLFSTAEDVPGTGDADGLDDWFLAGPDETVLLTGSNPRRTGGQHVFAAHPVRAGDRFLFTTDEAIPGSGDRDGAHDVYLSTPLAAPPPPQPPAGVSQAGGGGRESSGADAGANTPSTPPAGPPRDATAPRFSRPLRLHRTRFRFGLTEPATVTITVTRERPGRRVGGRCRVPTRRTRRAPRCVRLFAVGRLRHEAPAGVSTVRFDARVVARRRLRPGRYRATAVARDAAGNASQARVRFVIRAAGG